MGLCRDKWPSERMVHTECSSQKLILIVSKRRTTDCEQKTGRRVEALVETGKDIGFKINGR